MNEIVTFFSTEPLNLIVTGISTALFPTLFFFFQNRRALITYNISYNRIGQSVSDKIFGDIKVTVGGHEMSNLYLTTLRITNKSIKDLENLIFKNISSINCGLLSESSIVEGTAEILHYTDDFNNRAGLNRNERTQTQIDISLIERSYDVPVFNRGQIITISYLVNAAPNVEPLVHLSCLSKGVKVKRLLDIPPTSHVWGIPIPSAALVGLCIMPVFIFGILLTIENDLFGLTISGLLGAFCAVTGALIIKSFNWVKSIIVG